MLTRSNTKLCYIVFDCGLRLILFFFLIYSPFQAFYRTFFQLISVVQYWVNCFILSRGGSIKPTVKLLLTNTRSIRGEYQQMELISPMRLLFLCYQSKYNVVLLSLNFLSWHVFSPLSFVSLFVVMTVMFLIKNKK